MHLGMLRLHIEGHAKLVAALSTAGIPMGGDACTGAGDLPKVEAEADEILRRADGTARLLGTAHGAGPATRETVLDALRIARWAHFACHAIGDLESPSRGRILLEDGEEKPLTIKDLSGLDVPGAQLAYLSACKTGRPSASLVDEVVDLATAFHAVGYRHVVATMWPIGDKSAAFVTKGFYENLLPEGTPLGGVDFDASALALHTAVTKLRDAMPERPSRWAAHVHVGRVGPSGEA